MFIIAKMMPIQYIADAEKDANMKSLSQEEAVEILSDMKIDIPVPKAAVTQRKRNVALDMAISALSCSEIPNSSDLISRQAAIDAMAELQGSTSSKGVLKGISKAWERIKQLPPIQPKRGKWIYCEDSTADCVDGYRCDQCGFFVPWDYQHKSIDYIKDYNFCPHCGADMRQKGKNNESN